MGTDFDDLAEKAATDYFEKKKKLNAFEKEAKKEPPSAQESDDETEFSKLCSRMVAPGA
jgi:hypothetical protein